MPVWLVTGASGFLGRHLLEQIDSLRGQNKKLVTLGRQPALGSPTRSHVVCDLENGEGLIPVIRDLAPDVVFHLAGQTPPASADRFYRANTLATVSLLDALRACERPSKVILVGSAAELGPVALDSLPVAEDFPAHPIGAYGLSKWLATVAGLATRAPLEVVIARVFNPIGPGLPASQALGGFAWLLTKGEGPCRLTVGNLETRRDFIDVRDVASALIALATRGQGGQIYHVGTGRSERVGDGLDRLIALSGRQVNVEVARRFAENPGPADSRADIARIQWDTGWSPRFSFDQSLQDLWRQASSGSG